MWCGFGVGVNCPNMSLYWIANINPTTGTMHVYGFDMTLGGTVNAGADYTEFGFSNNVVAFTNGGTTSPSTVPGLLWAQCR